MFLDFQDVPRFLWLGSRWDHVTGRSTVNRLQSAGANRPIGCQLQSGQSAREGNRPIGRPSGGLDSSGRHSGQGSIIPGITRELRLWKMIGSNTARLFAENFDAHLAGIVI